MRGLMIGVVLTGVLGSGLAFAQGSPIKQRQVIMEDMGKAIDTVGKMAKGEVPFDGKAAANAMKSIKETSVKFTTLFPEGTEKGENTRAKPEIWKNKKDFTDWGKQLEEDAGKAETAAASGLESTRTALAAVGKTCGGCHEDYRAPAKK